MVEKKRVYYKKRQQSQCEIENLWKEFSPCIKVLDLGCGVGSFGKYKPEGTEVYGIDIDAGAVKEAKKYENAKVGDITKKLPYANNFFDGILAKDILEHLIEPEKLVRECKRVLRGGGIVVASVPSPGKKFYDDYTHKRAFTERAIKELFLDNGFEIMYVRRLRGIPGFGATGLSRIVPYFLKIPIVSLLTQGYEVKAKKI